MFSRAVLSTIAIRARQPQVLQRIKNTPTKSLLYRAATTDSTTKIESMNNRKYKKALRKALRRAQNKTSCMADANCRVDPLTVPSKPIRASKKPHPQPYEDLNGGNARDA